MIFVTVGSMLPFDRLIRTMDQWAKDHPDEKILAQIGDGKFKPSHMSWVRNFSRQEFMKTVLDSRFIVAHAGIGSVLSALEVAKPLIVIPRRMSLMEHTNDHQLHTVAWLKTKPGIRVTMTDEDLISTLNDRSTWPEQKKSTFTPYAPEAFTARIREFLISS